MLLERIQKRGFQVECASHAEAILTVDFPQALSEIEQVLAALKIPIGEIVMGGGGESQATQRLRRDFERLGWGKRNFEIKKLINGEERQSVSHAVDHVRDIGGASIALEIEWNNKDPFFDRDLENFKRLHVEGAISAGVIITRGASFQANVGRLLVEFAVHNKITSFTDLEQFGVAPTARQKDMVLRRIKQNGDSFIQAWVSQFCSDKFGEATTHWAKLKLRISRGVGNPCPLLLIGIPDAVVSVKKP